MPGRKAYAERAGTPAPHRLEAFAGTKPGAMKDTSPAVDVQV